MKGTSLQVFGKTGFVSFISLGHVLSIPNCRRLVAVLVALRHWLVLSRSMVILIIMVSTPVETIIINITIERDPFTSSVLFLVRSTAAGRRLFGTSSRF